MNLQNILATLAVANCLILVICSRGPAPIPVTRFNAKQCAAKALELHDSNADGSLSSDELDASAGLSYAAKRADTNADGELDESELISMVDAWNKKSIGLITLRCNVKHRRRPLKGATIRLEPEPFLAGLIKAAEGVTDEFGDAFLSVPKDKRPIADAPPGAQLGLYRVVVSKLEKGQETIPDRFNIKTVIGQEVAFDDPGVLNGIEFELK